MNNHIGLDEAVNFIEKDLREDWHHDSGKAVHVWRPKEEQARTTRSTDGGSSPKLCLMADDGNFIVAVFACRKDPISNTVNARKPAKILRINGHMIRRTTLDAGIHRLVVQLVLADGPELHLALSKELPQSKDGPGQYRSVLLPHAAKSRDQFSQSYHDRRAAIGPLPSIAFLEPIAEAELAEYVGEALDTLLSPFQACVHDDVVAFLRDGKWEETSPWPSTRQALKVLIESQIAPESAV